MKAGVVGAFDRADALVAAARKLRSGGYRRLDAFTPYRVPELEDALELGRNRFLIRLIGVGGFTMAAAAYLVQWLTDAVDYHYDAGGRPAHAAPAFIVITAVTGVLWAFIVGFVGLLKQSGLPWLSNPIFAAEGFDSSSPDRFWIAVDQRDPQFSATSTADDLTRLGATQVQWVGKRPS